MLFDLAFDPQLKLQPPKIFPNISTYLGYLERETLSMIHRYQDYPCRHTPGIMVLEQVLTSLPIDDMVKEKDQYKRYMLLRESDPSVAIRDLDPAYNKQSGLKPSFCGTENEAAPNQYVLPTVCVDPLVDMPLGREWQAWKLMKPFRIGAIHTDQLSFFAYLDILFYQRSTPKFTVYTLNLEMLAMMYASYLESVKDSQTKDPISQFLHSYVVYPSLLRDNVNLWIRNRYQAVLRAHVDSDQPVRDSVFEDAIWMQANNGRIGTDYLLFIQELTRLTELLMHRNIYPDVYLSSCLLLNGVNVIDYFKHYQRMNDTPRLRQYNWIEYLRDSDWIDFFTLVLTYNKQWTQFSYFKSYLNRSLRLFQESHSWGDCGSDFISQYIQSHITNQIKRIDMERVN